jgi:hypothetical protein
MTRRANDVEAVSRQTQIKCFYERAGREFARHEHIAKNANAVSGNHCLDCMQFLPEAQVVRHAPPVRMIKLTETRQITPYRWVHPDEER